MPRLALALCVLWFVSLFVFRTVSQLRTTGSTGFNGFSGRVGSLPWIAGILVPLGLVLAPLAPIAALEGWSGGSLLIPDPALHALGANFALAGIVGALFAQHSMGSSWRIGVDESEKIELVTSGLFAWVRNPVFSFVWLSLLGLILLVSNAIALLGAAVTFIGIELQVRTVEEPYLEATHGDDYREYTANVGRFLPKLTRGSSSRLGEKIDG